MPKEKSKVTKFACADCKREFIYVIKRDGKDRCIGCDAIYQDDVADALKAIEVFCTRCCNRGFWKEQVNGPSNLRTVICGCGALYETNANNPVAHR